MKVLGVVGSKRKNGNTATMVRETLNTIEKEGFETELIFLGDYNINSCNGCEGCRETFKCVVRDDMQKIYPSLLAADALVLGSPTYFYNISSDMKAFIERCYPYEIFAEDDRSVWMSINEARGIKYAVAIAICEQYAREDMGFTVEAMTKPLEALGYRVVDAVGVLGAFKQGDVLKQNSALEQARQAGEKLAKTLKLRKSVEEKLAKINV